MVLQSLSGGRLNGQLPRIDCVHRSEAAGRVQAGQRQQGWEHQPEPVRSIRPFWRVHGCEAGSGADGELDSFGAIGSALCRRARPFSGVGSVMRP